MSKYVMIIADGGLFIEERNPPTRDADISKVIKEQMKGSLVALKSKYPAIEIPSDQKILDAIAAGKKEVECRHSWAPQYPDEIWKLYCEREKARTKGQFVAIKGMKEVIQSFKQEGITIVVIGFREPAQMKKILQNLGYTCEVLSEASSQQDLDLHIVPTEAKPPIRLPNREVWDQCVVPYFSGTTPQNTVAICKESGDLGLAQAVGIPAILLRYAGGDLDRVMGTGFDLGAYSSSTIPELVTQLFNQQLLEEETSRPTP